MHDALHHMSIGGKAVALVNDRGALGLIRHQRQAVNKQLVQVERGVVDCDQLLGRSPQKQGERRTDALRGIEPVGAMPGMPALGGPFIKERARHPRGNRARHRPHGVTVEIDTLTWRPLERFAESGKRIHGIQRKAVIERDHGVESNPFWIGR